MPLKKMKIYFYLIYIFQGFFIWYAIDKIFFQENGATVQQIVLLGAMAWVPQLIFEVPSSILADRWSRKRVLFLGQMFFVLSTFILALGSSISVFMIGIFFWAVASSLVSGTAEALIYDSLKIKGKTSEYQKVIGVANASILAGLLISGLVGYFISIHYELRIAFYATLPMLAFALFLISKLVEPPISRTSHQGLTWFEHLGDVARAMRSKMIRWTVVLVVFLTAYSSSFYEYYQLLGLEKGLSVQSVALLLSAIFIGEGVASLIFSRIKITKRVIILSWVLLSFTAIFGLTFSNPVLVFANIFLLFVFLEILGLYLELILQNGTESSIRASVLSFANSLGQLLFLIYVIFIFFAINNFGATAVLVIVGIPMIALGVVDIKRFKYSTLRQT